MNVTIGMNNMVTSDEAQRYLRSKFPDFKNHTFRNALYLKHLKPTKVEKHGNKNILLFDHQALEAYVRYRANLIMKQKPKRNIRLVKSPDLKEYTFEVYQQKVDLILQVFTKDELDARFKSVVDSLYTRVKMKLDEIEAKKNEILQEVKQSIG